MSNPRDTHGLTIHYSGDWELVDVSINDFNPGRPFRLLIGVAGDLKIKGSVMNKKKVDIPLCPMPVGFAPMTCDIVYNDAGNTADNIIALY